MGKIQDNSSGITSVGKSVDNCSIPTIFNAAGKTNDGVNDY